MKQTLAIILLFIASVVTICSAYNFDDPVFNQFLANELDEQHEQDDLELLRRPRSRRDEDAAAVSNQDKCKSQRKKKLCCAEETFEDNQEKHREFKRECYKQITGKEKQERGEMDPFRCDKVDKHRREMTCIMQCVGQKRELLDAAGDPNEREFAAYVTDTMSKEPWFASVQEQVIAACLDEARNATRTDTPPAEAQTACNPAGVKLLHCLFREIQLGCPADQIKDQKACSRARDKIRRHNEFFPAHAGFMNDE